MLTESDREGRQTQYGYTERGLLKSIATDEKVITYPYDGAGRISEVRDDISRIVWYSYNELGLVASEIRGTEAPVIYTYNAVGLIEKVERGNEILVSRSYDKAGRLVREKAQGVPEKTYRYLYRHLESNLL